MAAKKKTPYQLRQEKIAYQFLSQLGQLATQYAIPHSQLQTLRQRATQLGYREALDKFLEEDWGMTVRRRKT